MAKTRHNAKTGQFVSKEYAAENPDRVVEVKNHNLKKELEYFRKWVIETHKDINADNLIEAYLAEKQN